MCHEMQNFSNLVTKYLLETYRSVVYKYNVQSSGNWVNQKMACYFFNEIIWLPAEKN